MQKALEQDSSVYEYDSVYDDIQKQRLESNQKILGGTDKRVSLKFLFRIWLYKISILKFKKYESIVISVYQKKIQPPSKCHFHPFVFFCFFVCCLQPKYIHQLMRAVEERKKEQDRRDDRKIQKEREAEGEKFADKDAFVTSAYRQKLKEREEELEREKREAAMEGKEDEFILKCVMLVSSIYSSTSTLFVGSG